jgi:hypothetical protein
MAKKCNKYKDDSFSKYSNVWRQSRETFVNEFLRNEGGLTEPDKLTEQQKAGA